jgi:phosphonate transport system permease protein
VAAADIAVTALNPWAEMARLAGGLLRPTSFDRSLERDLDGGLRGAGRRRRRDLRLWTRRPLSVFAPVRVLATVLRSVHELFWALLLIQVFGLGPTTGLLAIALPYTGFFAKVFAEMIEEADLAAVEVLPNGVSLVSAFFYGRLPDLLQPFKTYTLYRLECGLRSTLVLGFVGLPTIGFHLESYFKQGHYGQAAALLGAFYVLIGTRRIWARPSRCRSCPGQHPLLRRRWAAARRGRTSPASSATTSCRRRCAATILGRRDLGRLWRLAAEDPCPRGGARHHPDARAVTDRAGRDRRSWPWRHSRPCRGVSPGGSGSCSAGPGSSWFARRPNTCWPMCSCSCSAPRCCQPSWRSACTTPASSAYLMGRHADLIDYRPDAPKGLSLYAYETVPRLYGQFLAYMLYRWEIIIRESAIFGILGVATLGYYVDAAISELRFDAAFALIVVVVLLSAFVDALSRRLRRALRIDTLPVRLSAATCAPAVAGAT